VLNITPFKVKPNPLLNNPSKEIIESAIRTNKKRLEKSIKQLKKIEEEIIAKRKKLEEYKCEELQLLQSKEEDKRIMAEIVGEKRKDSDEDDNLTEMTDDKSESSRKTNIGDCV